VLPALGKHEIGTLGRALEAMRDKLEGKEYVEEVMQTLAHELKSPIAAIQGSAELLREDMPGRERQRFLGNILSQNAAPEAADRQAAGAGAGREAAAAGRARTDRARRTGGPGRGRQCAARLAARGLSLDSWTWTMLALLGDALLLRQALGNLVDNAADFAPPGSASASARGSRGRARLISVCDRGPGIPEFAQERLFDRFYSLPRPDGARSTGLGLPFVREVAALHQGSATVANQDGGGACAILDLPAA
jgi:two-component system sensor histidine kinase CreC